LVNNDYFAVTFNQLPNKPLPHNTEQFTAEGFIFYVRTHINDFVDTFYGAFSPSNITGIEEGLLWYSGNPMDAVVHIEIPTNDGSVIVSGHHSNPINSHWMFTTIQVPFKYFTVGADGPHPVSGNRKFGLKKNSNGSYTFYTRGVDRVQGNLGKVILSQNILFSQADNLWDSFQDGLVDYIHTNSSLNPIFK
jgi:hypothetical protein